MRSSIVKALNGFDTSVNGTGDGGAFGMSTVMTTTLGGNAILQCITRLPRSGQGILCISARRDPCRYLGIVAHVLQVTNLPSSESGRGLRFLTLEGCAPRRHVEVIRRTVCGAPRVNLMVVSNVQSVICSVGDPDRSAHVVSGLVR